MEKAYRNVSYLFLFILASVFAGFFQSYFGLIPRFQGVPLAAHFHAVGFLLWCGMLIAQPLLIRYNHFALHRALGKFSYFLVPYMALTVVGVSMAAYHEKGDVWLLALQPPGLYFACIGFFNFVFFYILAMVYKRNPAYHMRYIIVASLALLPPGVGRLFGNELKWGVVGAILVPLSMLLIPIALIVFDKVKSGKVYPPYVIGLAVNLLIDISIPLIPPTHLWQSIALKAGHYL